MTSRLLPALALAAGTIACGASATVVSLPYAGPDAGSEASALDAPTVAEPDAAAEASSDVEVPACSTCVDATITWGPDGGLVAARETSTLAPCHAYTHERRARGAEQPRVACNDEFVSCDTGAALSPGLLARALADPYVQTALTNAPVLYGDDPRPVDGTVFRMVIDGKVIEIGACAIDDEACLPPGVASLANLLRSIDDDLLSRPTCGDAFAAE